MIKVEFSTRDNKHPIFELPNYKISCFFDTGANIPVWNGSLKLFKTVFKNCNPVDTDVITSIGGFGIGTIDMPVYKISNFELTDGKQQIIFNELYIAIEDNRTRNFDLLLTYSMFKNINIVIRATNKNRKITFAIDKHKRFSSTYTLDAYGKICYTESCLQQLVLTEQDIMANKLYKLIQNSNI